MLNIANILTLSRIAAIPVIVGLLFLDQRLWHWVSVTLFIIAGITDFLDGYLARRMEQVSALGRFLDPIADKLVVAATLLVLVAARHIEGWVVLAALIILCREILVSGLREYLAQLRVDVPVTLAAKWKTTAQMVAIGFLIVGKAGPVWPDFTLIGETLLWIAALLTLWTGYDYMRVGVSHMRDDRGRGRKIETN
jgi:CDP-diacylglycerol--glycerol-3-phosphate 3-phosphatidyltransferase